MKSISTCVFDCILDCTLELYIVFCVIFLGSQYLYELTLECSFVVSLCILSFSIKVVYSSYQALVHLINTQIYLKLHGHHNTIDDGQTSESRDF